MPWSAKAQGLLREQYAPVGTAARVALRATGAVLERARARGVDVGPLLLDIEQRTDLAARYVDAYRRYCWPVQSTADLRLAPFHLLASEGMVYTDTDHLWHMALLARICQAGEASATPLVATDHLVVDLTDPAGEAEGIRWWEELTTRGGEGMVVKPLNFVARG